MPRVFSLIISLAVVALSGAVVIFIVLREENQPATSPPGPKLQLPEPEPEQAPPPATPAPRPRRATVRSAAPPARHRVRSAVLLVFLLATVGALLALIIAVALGLLVMAMRAGVG